jgi:hypothetical protein
LTTHDILTFLFGSGILVTIGGYLLSQIRANKRKTDAVCKGLQALLRDRLLQCYNYYAEKGYAHIEERDNFENMWSQYHNLGANGVMDDIHEKFLKLPTERRSSYEQNKD